MPKRSLLAVALLLAPLHAMHAQDATPAPSPLEAEVRERTAAINDQLIAWRRDIHQHPELGNQ